MVPLATRRNAPYDRIIVTAAVKLGRVPYAWVEQTKPGGTIVAPVKQTLLPVH